MQRFLEGGRRSACTYFVKFWTCQFICMISPKPESHFEQTSITAIMIFVDTGKLSYIITAAQLTGYCENTEPAKGGNKIIGPTCKCIQGKMESCENVSRMTNNERI